MSPLSSCLKSQGAIITTSLSRIQILRFSFPRILPRLVFPSVHLTKTWSLPNSLITLPKSSPCCGSWISFSSLSLSTFLFPNAKVDEFSYIFVVFTFWKQSEMERRQFLLHLVLFQFSDLLTTRLFAFRPDLVLNTFLSDLLLRFFLLLSARNSFCWCSFESRLSLEFCRLVPHRRCWASCCPGNLQCELKIAIYAYLPLSEDFAPHASQIKNVILFSFSILVSGLLQVGHSR